MEGFETFKGENGLWSRQRCWEPPFTKQLDPYWHRIVDAGAIVNGDGMRPGSIKNGKVLGSSKRTWTRNSWMAELIAVSKLFKAVLIKKLPIPLLSTKSGDLSYVKWSRRTSIRCKGSSWCKDKIQSGHFNILPLGQSLHFMTPSHSLHTAHFEWPKKSPRPSWRRISSRKVSLNDNHSLSLSWWCIS